jgi:hypothetical protein
VVAAPGVRAKKTSAKGCPQSVNVERSLSARFPDLAAEWAGSNPMSAAEIGAGSAYRAAWLCALGHEFTATVERRVQRRSACPVCTNRTVLAGFNDLATTHPALAAEWDPANELAPTEVMAGSGKQAAWICSCGHRWRSRIDSRGVSGTGCPPCARRKMNHPGRAGCGASLEALFPDIAAEWDADNDSRPADTAPHSAAPVLWLCAQCSRRWTAAPAARTRRPDAGARCPRCSTITRRVRRGINDLATTHPHLVAEFAPGVNRWAADQLSAGSRVRIVWACPDGHRWVSEVADRVRSQTGCPQCAGRTSGKPLAASRHAVE